MNKFPMLEIYQFLLWILAGLGLVAAALGFIEGLSGRPGGLGTALATSIPGLSVALGAGVLAEVITIFVRIEDHLDRLRHAQERTNEILSPRVRTPDADIVKQPDAAPKPLQQPITLTGDHISITSPAAFLYMGTSDTSIKMRKLGLGEKLALMGESYEGWYATRMGYVRTADAELHTGGDVSPTSS